jgi:hypothetical protein
MSDQHQHGVGDQTGGRLVTGEPAGDSRRDNHRPVQPGPRPLTAINSAANPYIEQFANTVEGIGNQYGTSFAPVGPAIVGLSGDIRFFEGS